MKCFSPRPHYRRISFSPPHLLMKRTARSRTRPAKSSCSAKPAKRWARGADFDLLRILSHQLERSDSAKSFHYKNPAAVFEEIRKAVAGYNMQPAGLLTGGAEPTRLSFSKNGHAPYDVPVHLIRSANDTLFTSGTLGRFCTMMQSLPEAEANP